MFVMILKRLGAAVLVLLLVSLSIFVATRVLPGDAAQAILGRDATPERLAALRAQLDLTGSPVSQYADWLVALLHLDFGTSLSNGRPVSGLLFDRVSNSVVLMLAAAVIGVVPAILLGGWTAYRRDSVVDHAATVLSLLVSALPEFVVGMLLIILLSTGLLHLLPATATMTPILGHPAQLVLPALTLGLAIIPYILRMVRASLIEVLESDYVQFARLSGLSEATVFFRYAAINVLGTTAQVVALQLAYLAGGVVVVEYLFGFPGIGTAIVDAVNNRDLPMIQATTLFIAAFYIIVNLIADALTALANPRTRHAAK